MSCSSRRPRTPGFQSGNAGSLNARSALDVPQARAEGRGRMPEQSRTRRQSKEPSSSSRFEGGNRPRRLGGAGTRDRMELRGGVAQYPVKQPPCKRQAAGSNPVTSTIHASLTQRPECRRV
jgi:hypothetical protein